MIRLSDQKDLQSIVQISQKSFSKPWPGHEYLKIANYQDYAIYVYEKKAILAYAIFYFPYGGEDIELLEIAVDPTYRNQKIARQFLATVLKDFKSKNYLNLFLEVHQKNQIAIHVYEQLGFEIIGIRKNYYAYQEDAYVMRKRL